MMTPNEILFPVVIRTKFFLLQLKVISGHSPHLASAGTPLSSIFSSLTLLRPPLPLVSLPHQSRHHRREENLPKSDLWTSTICQRYSSHPSSTVPRAKASTGGTATNSASTSAFTTATHTPTRSSTSSKLSLDQNRSSDWS